MKRIRIAQIGMNRCSHGDAVAVNLKKIERFKFVGYCLPEGEREKFPQRLTCFEGLPELALDEILRDTSIEAVAVETDEIYLTKYALMAAKAGKHVYMEKPGGADLSAFEELVETLRAGNKVFHVGYMYRYNPVIRQLLARIRKGELGEILNVEAQMNCRHEAQVRQWMESMPGGMMFFLGCHLIDLVMQIQGEPLAVHPLNGCSGLDGTSALDSGFAALIYPTGTSFVKTNNVERGGFLRRQLVVTGSRETVEIKPLEVVLGPGRQVTELTCYDSDSLHERPETLCSEEYGRYRPMIEAFAAEVAGECENPYSYDYELALYKTVLKASGLHG